MKTRNARRYYAEYCPYGLNTVCDGNVLMIFEAAAERDEMIGRLNSDWRKAHIVEGVARATTRKEATGTYRTQDIGREGEVEIDFRCARNPVSVVFRK